MPPLVAPVDHKDGSSSRQRQRSASFHGRGAEEQQQQQQQRHALLRQRPRTQPDLLAGIRAGKQQHGFRPRDACSDGAETERRRAPSRVLLTVGVRQSMWPLHVMARAEWRVADLVAAAVELYVREGRRPLLPSSDPAAFGLHFSQFSLQSLGPDEKLMELGSRSFFLCPKAAANAAVAAAATAAVAAGASPAGLSGEDDEAKSAKKPNVLAPWLGFIHFWPLL
uniref:DUF7054 domain-containing protein n=1 Tax=Leersia perrieri TaxID=77586 RepID=A0A0D9VGJ9_9ORYZ